MAILTSLYFKGKSGKSRAALPVAAAIGGGLMRPRPKSIACQNDGFMALFPHEHSSGGAVRRSDG
jgi:hypothetical protein